MLNVYHFEIGVEFIDQCIFRDHGLLHKGGEHGEFPELCPVVD